MIECTVRNLLKSAVVSRLLVLVLQILFNYVIPDHEPDVFNPPSVESPNGLADSLVEFLLGGFRRWDSIYMLHIAEHGYTYENTIAFFPAFPFIVRSVGFTVLYPLFPLMTARHVLMIAAFLVNTTFFILAVWYLYKLAHLLIGKGNHPWFAAMLFCFNPASIFMSAAYSESSFALFSFSLMYYIETKQLTKATMALALATATRSNGILLAGYPMYLALKMILTSGRFTNFKNFLIGTQEWFKVITCVLYGLAPFCVFQLMCYVLYCKDRTIKLPEALATYGRIRNYQMSDDEPNEWCYYQIPYAYGYIQHSHWNVGLFHYFEWIQLPNFLLAVPVIILSLYSVGVKAHKCLTESREVTLPWLKLKSMIYLPYTLHLLFLVLYCFTSAHVQIMTRMIYSSSPLVYISLANHFSQFAFKGRHSYFLSFVVTCNIIYFVIGIAMHSNFYPWT